MDEHEQANSSLTAILKTQPDMNCHEGAASLSDQVAKLSESLAFRLDNLLQERNKELVGIIESLLVSQTTGVGRFTYNEGNDMHAGAGDYAHESQQWLGRTTPRHIGNEERQAESDDASCQASMMGTEQTSLTSTNKAEEQESEVSTMQCTGRRSITSLSSEEEQETRACQIKSGRSAADRRTCQNDAVMRVRSPTCSERVRQLSESMQVQLFFSLAMVTNCALIGAQVQYMAMHPSEREEPIFIVLQQIYAAIFLIELVVKLIAEGRFFFWPSSWGHFFWNCVDVASVGSSLAELALFLVTANAGDAGIQKGPTLRIIRILRIVRLVRIVRLMRLVRLISSLRRLIQSILATMTALGWSFVLLFMIIYMFGIIFADIVTSVSTDPEAVLSEATRRILEEDFTDLHKSMISLFFMISNGYDWGNMFNAFFEVHWLLAYALLTYVAFSVFAVLNVMTGTFCQFAIESASRDQDFVLQSVLATKNYQTRMIRSFFRTFGDPDGVSGEALSEVTLYDFENRLRAPDALSFFQCLDIDVHDAWTLFKLMVPENNGVLNADDFMEGCLRLRGAAKQIDIAVMMREQRRMKKKVESILDSIHALGALCAKQACSAPPQMSRQVSAGRAGFTV